MDLNVAGRTWWWSEWLGLWTCHAVPFSSGGFWPGGFAFERGYIAANATPKCIRLYASADHSATHFTFSSPRTSNRPSPRQVLRSALTVSHTAPRLTWIALACSDAIRCRHAATAGVSLLRGA